MRRRGSWENLQCRPLEQMPWLKNLHGTALVLPRRPPDRLLPGDVLGAPQPTPPPYTWGKLAEWDQPQPVL
jgi:hypothetical protein